MPSISTVIITLNEEKNIERCINSLIDVVDEIVIIDSFSTDKTEEICRKYPVKFIQHPFEGYIEQKNWATRQATYDYILSLDADEALSDKLKQSILEVKKNWTHDAYTFNRLTNYCGKWIRHTSWYPARKLRLFDRRKGQWDGINPHDKFVIDKNATVKHLEGDLLHYSFYTISDQIRQINNFTDILAKAYHQKGLVPNIIWHIIFHPIWRFVRDYFIKMGFLDGLYGLVISANSAFEVYLKYLKLRKILEIEMPKTPFRICFFNSDIEWNNETEWYYNNIVKLQEKGHSAVIAAPSQSFLLKRVKSKKIHYYIIKTKHFNYIYNFYNAIRFIRYLKHYKIASIIVSNAKDIPFVSFCAKLAGIKEVILHRNSYQPMPTSILYQYYFRYVINKVIIDNDKIYYALIMNNYKLITKEKVDILKAEDNYEITPYVSKYIS